MRDGMDGGEGRRGKEGRKEGSLSLSQSLARWVDLPLQRFAVAFVHTKVSGNLSHCPLSLSPGPSARLPDHDGEAKLDRTALF